MLHILYSLMQST